MKTKMHRHMMTTFLLAGLAAGAVGARAQDMGGMPGMNMPGMGQAAGQTNTGAADTQAVVKPYPFDYCLVSGDKLEGDMGKPVRLVYQGQEMKFCCKDCVKDFKKNPAKWMKKLAEAEAKAAADKKQSGQ